MLCTEPDKPQPKVSVLIITYDHERFIAQAVESALMQEVNFDYEIVIGEDCSTDRTRNIIVDLQRRYPDKIRLSLTERNLGASGGPNFARALQRCRGVYIAFCEGDDYWISPTKLQKQIDVLENNPQIAGCFSNAIIVDENNRVIAEDYFAYHKRTVKPEIRTEDIVPFGISPANTMVFRRNIFIGAPDWFTRNTRHSGIDLLITLHGIYYCINEKLGAYRIHSGGVWSLRPLSGRLLNDLIFLKPMYHDEYMRKRYGAVIRRTIENEIRGLYACRYEGESVAVIARCLVRFSFAYPWDAALQMVLLRYGLSDGLGLKRQTMLYRLRKVVGILHRIARRLV